MRRLNVIKADLVATVLGLNYKADPSGVFMGVIGSWPPFGNEIFFHYRKKIGNIVWPPSLCEH